MSDLSLSSSQSCTNLFVEARRCVVRAVCWFARWRGRKISLKFYTDSDKSRVVGRHCAPQPRKSQRLSNFKNCNNNEHERTKIVQKFTQLNFPCAERYSSEVERYGRSLKCWSLRPPPQRSSGRQTISWILTSVGMRRFEVLFLFSVWFVRPDESYVCRHFDASSRILLPCTQMRRRKRKR